MLDNVSKSAYGVSHSTMFWVAIGSLFVGWGTNWAIGIGVFILTLLFTAFIGAISGILFQILQKLK